MAFPWIFSENFEGGTVASTLFNSESDGDSILDIAHYSELARQGMAPWTGSYCMRVKPNGGTTDATLFETDGFDTAGAGTVFVRFNVYLGKDLRFGASDKFAIFEMESVANTTTEVSCGFDISSGTVRFWVNETRAAAAASTLTLGTTTTALGKWYAIELKVVLDNAGANDGTIDAWVNGAALTQIASLDQGVIVDAKFGVMGIDAGTIGTILFDQIIADDAQVYPAVDRFNMTNRWCVDPHNHPLIGPGKFAIAATGTGTTGNLVVTGYDADGVPNPASLPPIFILRNTAANEMIPGHDIFEVRHGLYLTLSGTAGQAFVSIDRGGLGSEAHYVDRGLKTRTQLPRVR